MDKPAIDQSNKDDQTPKTSVTSNTVLSILKRFRSRQENAEDKMPSFDERLGVANGPLAERISEISSRIEAGRTQGNDTHEPDSHSTESGEPTVSDQGVPAEVDAEPSDEADVATDNTDARPNPRVRSMGFHNPVFPTKAPDEPKDPDFLSYSEPPQLKLHDSSVGVMENFGAPGKSLTAPKEKAQEPLDLKAFAEQVRAKLPKQEPPDTTKNGNGADAAETKAAAEDFKNQFYARISKASKAAAFEGFSFQEEPNVLRKPSGLTNSGLHNATASSALHNWRQFNSSPDHAAADMRSESLHETSPPVKSETPEWNSEVEDVASPETNELDARDIVGSEEQGATADYSAYEPHFDVGHYEEEQDEILPEAEDQETLAELAEAIEPETTPATEPEPEIFADFNSPPVVSDTEPEQAPEEVAETTSEAPPQNVFAALDVDEDDILVKVYDLIQAELQAAWGENITLNIRKIVREEVRAALKKARSDF